MTCELESQDHFYKSVGNYGKEEEEGLKLNNSKMAPNPRQNSIMMWIIPLTVPSPAMEEFPLKAPKLFIQDLRMSA